MEITMHSIGVIHSPFTEKHQTPIQSSRSQAIGLVELYPEFADGLKDIYQTLTSVQRFEQAGTKHGANSETI